MSTPANALDITAAGLVKFDGITTFSGVTTTQHGVLIGAASNGITSSAVGSSGQILQGNTGADPTYSTATFPSTATSTGTILRANGTNWVATTATYPTTTTSQQILYSTAANVVGELTTANSALAATNSSGTLAMRLFSVNIQTFVNTGTYTPTAGMLYCIIECVGGGGGGGGSASASVSTTAIGGGGGGGGYARKFASAATIGASQAVTIGAAGLASTAGNNPGGNGGDSSVAAICIGKGGTGGSGNPGNGPGAPGGAGGIAGTGDLTFPGSVGTSGSFLTFAAGNSLIANGGASYFGGSSLSTTVNAAGTTGSNYGGGGGGAVSQNAGGNFAGGAGAKGVVIITEYVIA